MGSKFTYYGSYLFSVCNRFISAHEAATGQTMEATQKAAICQFTELLSGNGTVNGSDLLTKFTDYGTLLFPCCPTSDTVATAAGYELDLLSGTKQGEYINFLPADITPMGAQGGSSSAKIFRTFKGAIDYPLGSGFDFAYQKEAFIATSTSNYVIYQGLGQETLLIPRHHVNGWSYCYFNSNFDASLASPRIFRGIIGMQQNLGQRRHYYIDNAQFRIVYGNFATAPTTNNNTWLDYHFGTWGGEISMYCTRAPQLSSLEMADLNEAVSWYQDNVLSTGTRKTA